MLITKDSTFIMVGDSVTDCGRKRPDGEDISTGNGWGDGYVNLVRSHLGAFYPQYGIRVINKGNSGEQSSDLLPRWEEDVLAYKPEWVSILMGINDVWRIFDSWNITQSHGNREVYEKSMRHVIENTLPVTKNIILMAPYFIESNKQDAMRQEMDAYGAICKQLADEYGLFFIDLQATFDSVLEHVHPMYFGWDRIHPNAIGHTLIAKKILEVIEA
ncbi:MAG: SGNH/GDSL hydrolase family protein [Cellulosilyticaceae bacterium]